MKSEIMTPQHGLWDLFIDRLSGVEGCDWGEDGWTCYGSGDSGLYGTPAALPFATRILRSIPNIDVEGSLQHFIDNGGHCDCEVVLNIDPVE
jgi:hypothetical protein